MKTKMSLREQFTVNETTFSAFAVLIITAAYLATDALTEYEKDECEI